MQRSGPFSLPTLVGWLCWLTVTIMATRITLTIVWYLRTKKPPCFHSSTYSLLAFLVRERERKRESFSAYKHSDSRERFTISVEHLWKKLDEEKRYFVDGISGRRWESDLGLVLVGIFGDFAATFFVRLALILSLSCWLLLHAFTFLF